MRGGEGGVLVFREQIVGIKRSDYLKDMTKTREGYRGSSWEGEGPPSPEESHGVEEVPKLKEGNLFIKPARKACRKKRL